MKLRLPKRRRYRIYLYLLSILIILVAIDLLLVRIGRHITIAKDTTYITSPLKPDGTPDYFQAIDDQRAAGVTPTNNAAMILIPLVYSGQLMDEEKAEVFQKLHVLPPENEATAFVHYLGYLSRKHGEPFARAHMARHTTYQPDDDERAGRRHGSQAIFQISKGGCSITPMPLADWKERASFPIYTSLTFATATMNPTQSLGCKSRISVPFWN